MIIFDFWQENDQIISQWSKGKNKNHKEAKTSRECMIPYDPSSHIDMNLELYECKELMANKTHVKKYGVTTATTFHLMHPYHSSDWQSFRVCKISCCAAKKSIV